MKITLSYILRSKTTLGYHLICSFIIILILTSSANATTYYIDYPNSEGTSADTNSGTSISTAWIHCPGDPRAVSYANKTLSPGDIVVFKGGITYYTGTSPITVNASGTVGNVITFRSGHIHGPVWGTGRAVMDATASTSNGITMTDRHDITIEGIQFQNLLITPDQVAQSVNALIVAQGASGNGNILIDNVVVTNTTVNGIEFSGTFTTSTKPTGFTVKNSSIYEIGAHGIFNREGLDGITIQNNLIHDVGHVPGNGIWVGTNDADSETTNVVISGNEIYNSHTKGCMNVQGQNILIERNYCHGSLAFGIAIDITYTGGSTRDITIRNNIIDANPTLEGLIRVWTNYAGTVSNLYIYNNTLKGTGAGCTIMLGAIILPASAPNINNVVIKNNLFYIPAMGYGIKLRVAAGKTLTDWITNLSIDYNHYYYTTTAKPFLVDWVGKTFAEWKLLGYDTFSHAQNVDPNLDGFYNPLSNSSLRNAGADLSSEGFSDDKDGLQRFPGIWDIGAFVVPPRPPLNLRIIQ